MTGSTDTGTAPCKLAVSATKGPATKGPATKAAAAKARELAPDGEFQDGKDAKALRTIGEVARALGLRQHVLRYWEEQFPMLHPLTHAGGRRYYRPEDIALLRQIDRLVHHQGYTIRGARLALVKPGVDYAVDMSPDSGEPGAEIVTAMAVLRAHLNAIRARLSNALASS
jgi:DNA-binding transcriptional MerR regulator